MSRSSSWLPSTAKTPCGAESGARASATGCDEAAIAKRDVVAAEDDQVRALVHQQLHRRVDRARAGRLRCDGDR